jgi:hypothetical protein
LDAAIVFHCRFAAAVGWLHHAGPSKNPTQPIIMRLTGREGEMEGQAIGIHDRVNFAR